ncbi:hypothetical protein GCM10028803_58640 [Larkinella knui]|uniref:histidine kinase n=1 Tax=Larkinella knui TaxID=2025310 RepID=A0A3P1CAA3_9BACT|nr:histidine kinase dimerization/phosphoacceptor domain -containing protein [Larkinella knui]RRB10229.1 hypothetical protein EHT87_28725 [Larkinella knui]
MNVRQIYALLLIGLTFVVIHPANSQTTWLPASLGNAPDSTKLWTLRHVGDSLVNRSLFSQAKQAYEQSLAIARTSGNVDAIGISNRSIGFWHYSIGDYGQAITWYQRALASFQKTGNQYHRARTLLFISSCYDRLHDDRKVRQYLNQGMTLAQQIGNTALLVSFYNNMATLESHQRRYQQAAFYQQKVLDYYRSVKDWPSYYGVLVNAGLLQKNRGDFARSERTFRQVLAYADKNKDTFLQGYTNASLPYALIPLNKLDEAEEACRKALVWAEQTGAESHAVLEEVNGHLSRIWEKRGDYRQALLFYQRQMASHDSVFNATKNQQIAELETRYQTQQKEDNIKLLAATNALQTRQIWASTAGLVVVTVLLGLLYGLYNRVRESRRKIRLQSDQMALMMKELHHRVKNNLAIVSTLLKLQSKRLDDEKAVQAVRVGQQRVEAMALIHQRLYQTDNVTSVNMRDYLTDLVESLLRAYGHQRDEFDLELVIDQPELDVDVAMPLGLIVNELATNAFKYAYSGAKRPRLRIALLKNGGQAGLTLEVQDNGPGIDSTDWQQSGNRASFGKRLIASLSEQLEGRFEFSKQNGTLFRLYIPQIRLQA